MIISFEDFLSESSNYKNITGLTYARLLGLKCRRGEPKSNGDKVYFDTIIYSDHEHTKIEIDEDGTKVGFSRYNDYYKKHRIKTLPFCIGGQIHDFTCKIKLADNQISNLPAWIDNNLTMLKNPDLSNKKFNHVHRVMFEDYKNESIRINCNQLNIIEIESCINCKFYIETNNAPIVYIKESENVVFKSLKTPCVCNLYVDNIEDLSRNEVIQAKEYTTYTTAEESFSDAYDEMIKSIFDIESIYNSSPHKYEFKEENAKLFYELFHDFNIKNILTKTYKKISKKAFNYFYNKLSGSDKMALRKYQMLNKHKGVI